jgi:hypothetical protein
MGPRLIIGARVAFALLAGATGVACEARSASVEQVQEQGVQMAQAARPTWWSGFNEAALPALHEVVRARTADRSAEVQAQADAEMLEAYIGLRVLNVRLLLAQEFGGLLDDQSRLLSASAPTVARAETLSALATRRAQVGELVRTLAQQRDGVVDDLARWCAIPTSQMASLLAPALEMHALPLFDAPLPARLPRAVLRARADVSGAETRLQLARRWTGPLQSWAGAAPVFAGWIETEPVTIASAPGEPLPDAEELSLVLSRAEAEVRENLRVLQRRGTETARRLEIVMARRAEFDAARRRVALGAGSTREVVDDYEALLVENDRLAVAGGALASSWIALQVSTAGRAVDPADAAPAAPDAASAIRKP